MLMEDEIKGQEVTQPETQSETPPKKSKRDMLRERLSKNIQTKTLTMMKLLLGKLVMTMMITTND